MGNGEQYIWKPPEEEEMLVHQAKALGPLGAHTAETVQPPAAVVRRHSRRSRGGVAPPSLPLISRTKP